VGALVYCRAMDFLGAAWDVDADGLRALDPAVDVDAVCASLEHIRAVCTGDAAAGADGRERHRRALPLAGRTAPSCTLAPPTTATPPIPPPSSTACSARSVR
jgi:hypothetical protein